MRQSSAVLVFAISVLVVTMCAVHVVGGMAGQEQSADKMTVEILIYSGRPNPTWELGPNEVAAVMDLLKGRPRIGETEPAKWSRLGFRGFRLRYPEGVGTYDEIRVFEGVICVRAGKNLRCFADKNNLEGKLIAAAKRRKLPEHVLKAIESYEKSRQKQTTEDQ